MPAKKNFIAHQSIIDADWLNQVDTWVATASGPPTSGTYNTGDFVKNANMVPLGTTTAQYLVTGWYCVQGGTPGTWMAVNLPMAPLASSGGTGVPPPPPPAPAGSPPPTPATTAYAYRVQAESIAGRTLKSDIPGYDGTGFSDWDTTAGITTTASFPNVPIGTFSINIRYYVYGTQQNTVKVDSLTGTSYQFQVQNPTAWATLTIPNVAITTAGTHTVSFLSDWGFTYLDYIELVQGASSSAALGTYPSGLPSPGPDSTATPGTTDASGSTTINNAITAAGAGGTVTLASKIYTINAPITPLANQTIQAAVGGGPVQLVAGNGYTGLMVNVNVAGVSIKNITFDGNYANRTAQEGLQTASCIQGTTGSTNLLVQNCRFLNIPSYAIWSYNAIGHQYRLNTGAEIWQFVRHDGNNLANDNVIIEGNNIATTSAVKSYQGIEMLNAVGWKIQHNTLAGFGLTDPTSHGFQGTWGNTLYITNSTNYTIQNNTCNPSRWSSCVCGAGSINGTVQNNYFDKGTDAQGVQAFWFEQTGADILTVTLNILNGGMSIGDTGGDHATITKNQVTCDSTGLDVNDHCYNLTATDNTFTSRGNKTQNGCFLWTKNTTSNHMTILRNTFTNFASGVWINNPGGTGTVYNCLVESNTFSNCTNGVNWPNTLTIDRSCNFQGFKLNTGYTFGARTDAYPYGNGVTGISNATMDASVKAAYDGWKNNRLAATANITPSSGIFAGQTLTGLYVDKFRPPNPGEPTYLCVSEGMGYAMLIVVLMAGYETNAKAIFDGLFRFTRAYPAFSATSPADPNTNNYLMSWRVGADLSDQGGGYNASDGDLDMALALFMAHRQWGSDSTTTTTTINYYQEGVNVVNALKKANFSTTGIMYVPGRDLSRSSDVMPFNFHVFKYATADTFWDTAVTNSYTMLNYVITNYSATAHLPPDWVYQPLTATPSPSPGGLIEGSFEGQYAANAVRDPWRWGQSYLFYGDSNYQGLTKGLINWFATSPPTSGNPSQLTWAYTLAGVGATTPNYFEPTTGSGLLVGAMAGLAPPVFNTLTTSTTGGTLAAGTYYYVITALNSLGETLKSNERSVVTTGTTSSNTLAWSAVPGATSYRVYRGTAAAGENVYYAPGNVTSYVDTNAASTGGSPAATNGAGWQTFLNSLWTTSAANLYTTYYNCELQLLALITASGNWWKPFIDG